MKKFLTSILIIINALLLNSCVGTNVGTNPVTDTFLKSDGEIAYDVLVSVVDSIESNDAETLKTLFSKKALDKSETIDVDIESLFNYYEGTANSFTEEDIEEPFVEYEREIDWERKYYEQWDKVTTDKQEYIIGIRYYTINTKNSNNEGIKAIGIIKAENGDYPFIDVDSDFYGVHISDE